MSPLPLPNVQKLTNFYSISLEALKYLVEVYLISKTVPETFATTLSNLVKNRKKKKEATKFLTAVINADVTVTIKISKNGNVEVVMM